MSQTSPGFSGFMNGLMNPEQMNGGGGPPPPMATQGPNAVPPSVSRGGNNSAYMSRPDLSMGSGRGNFNDGINIRENFGGINDSEKTSRPSRPEMKGPSDISDILSGLKTKTINIQESSAPAPVSVQRQNTSASQNENSTISISDLKELQSEGNMPKKSKRRQKSDKNTLSLDI
jgi:hypothetical protein